MPRGRPFQKGALSPNPNGRPLGARNRSTLAAAALLEGEAEGLARKAVELGLKGDMTALRICLDRLLPRCRERPLSFALPELKSAEDSVKAMAAIAEAVSSGKITLGEASEMVKVVEGFIRAIEVYDFDVRLKMLEAKSSRLDELKIADRFLSKDFENLIKDTLASKDPVDDESNETSHRNTRDAPLRKPKSSGDATARTQNV